MLVITNDLDHSDYSLSLDALNIETYAFTYPILDDLLSTLDESVPNHNFLEPGDHEVLVIAGINNVDHFTWVCEQNLHSSTEIPPAKIIALYKTAVEMILSFHKKMNKEIEESKEMLQMAIQLQGTSGFTIGILHGLI